MEGNNMSKKLNPYLNIGPGQIIAREMEALNWNQEDLAQILEMSVKSINHILNNRQSITIETAILLGKAFTTSPEFWLNLDQNYRLRLKTADKKESDTEVKAEIRKHMPLLEMRKKGWLSFDTSTGSQKKAFSNFWGIKEPHFDMYKDNKLFCARQAKENLSFTEYYTRTWFKKAQDEAAKIKSNPYDQKKLIHLLEIINNFTLKKNGVSLFIDELYNCGIKFFVLSHLEKTYLDGAAFISGDNPAVIYTARHKKNDSFWWTIVHELSHVLLHLKQKNKCFLDNIDIKSDTDKEEIEADEKTAQILKRNLIYQEFSSEKMNLTENRLLEISENVNLSPAVVLGILQYSGKATYRTKLNSYKEPVLDLIPKKYIKG